MSTAPGGYPPIFVFMDPAIKSGATDEEVAGSSKIGRLFRLPMATSLSETRARRLE